MRSRSDAVVSRVRWSGTLTAVAALVALLAIGPPGSARAATGSGPGYDQITGAGLTASAITVPWTQGLLDNTNTPIAAANADRSSANPTSPLSFMYPDFQNLKVTVSQTQDITHQGITVSWSGGEQTKLSQQGSLPATNFLQLMECYGDSSSGPSPQDCEFGSGLVGGDNAGIDGWTGDLCPPGAVASTSNPPVSLNGDNSQAGCDPEEPVQGANPPDVQGASPQTFNIPFVPVNDPTNPVYTQLDKSQYFNQFSTNEVPETSTAVDGTGQQQFETLTATEAPGLGCGEVESNGQPRNCWLVIVPRGQYEPNGYWINPLQAGQFMETSPLSASNWAMRMQIHLSYSPVQSFCPIGTQAIETVGTQLVARAVQSWQLALNKAAKCAKIYGYAAVPEATSTQQLADSGSGVGLAFTTIPIGSEAARDGNPATSLPPIVYAPVAVTAVGVGFNINETCPITEPTCTPGFISTPVKLTPELLAKSLTQAYRSELPDFYPAGGASWPGPSWAQSNPLNLTADPEFQQLNPEIGANGGGHGPLAPLLTEDHSALNQQVWQWIQGDAAATAWLNQGTTNSANSVTVDPAYTPLKLGTPPAVDSFPRAYNSCLDLGPSDPGQSDNKEEKKCSLDLLPYVNDYDQAATYVLTAVSPAENGGWDTAATAPDGSSGWWDKAGAELIGNIFLSAISATPNLAGYGLIDASLCSDSGTNCVGPSAASLTTALNSAKPDSAGLLQVDAANPGAGGYPLTQVTYAAVPTNLSAADLNNYADLIAYAAGAGQTPGVAPGDLPPGYLPLPASLQAKAQAVVAQLRADANASASPTPTPAATTPASSSTTPTAGTTAPTTPTTTGSGQITPTVSATPTVGLSISPPSAQLAATRTERQPVGAIRWALLVVVMAGAACAAAGTLLRSASVARWLRRIRP